MNRYNCLLILPNDTKDVTILADSVNPDISRGTRFFVKSGEYVTTMWGSSEQHCLVAQYPTDRLIIESIDENIENPD